MAFANTDTGIPDISAFTPFFGKFPTMEYDINNISTYFTGPHETVTDIFFRFGILRSIVNNTSSYYVYDILDSDTPELLAERVYNDRGAGWIILYANQIFDPQFDWPMNYDSFQEYIIGKYGSIEFAQTNIHHSEMTITRTNQFTGTVTTTNFQVDSTRLTDQIPSVPYAYYTPWTVTTFRTADSIYYTADDVNATGTLEEPPIRSDLTYDDSNANLTITRIGSIPTITDYQDYTFPDGTVVSVGTSGQSITYYDYELKLNDDKRLIKIIKQDLTATCSAESCTLQDGKALNGIILNPSVSLRVEATFNDGSYIVYASQTRNEQ